MSFSKIKNIKKIVSNLEKTISFSKLKISMDVEMVCTNKFKMSAYYPPIHYNFDYNRKVWIPTITSEKPYWEYDSKPSWIESSSASKKS